MTYILRDNNEEIRQKILDSGIGVCVCASFEDACWLDFHTSIHGKEVHGVGYYGEETNTQEEELKRFVNECKDPYYCVDVDELIERIKEYEQIAGEIADDILRTFEWSKEGCLEENLRKLAKQLKGEN